jgi:hypothetical protein
MSLTEGFWREVAENYPPVLVLVVIAAVLGIVFRHHLHWGDVPTWVLAATTLLAFVAAAFAGVVAYDLLRIESGRDEAAARDRASRRDAEQREQAGKVAAWFGTWDSPFPARPGSSQFMQAHGAVIRNASDLPVYQVRITFCVATSSDSGAPWQAREVCDSPEPILVIPPGVRTAEIPDGVRERETDGENEPKWLVGIQFIDADGRSWLRAPSGQLRQVPGRYEHADEAAGQEQGQGTS